MKRQFPYITVGKILEELNAELAESGRIEKGVRAITRATFYRLEKRLEFPEGRRTSGLQPWRIFSEEEKELIKEKIRNEYWGHA